MNDSKADAERRREMDEAALRIILRQSRGWATFDEWLLGTWGGLVFIMIVASALFGGVAWLLGW